MMKIELLNVKYHDQLVGTLSLTPDNKLCAFEYAPSWLADGFSISQSPPLSLVISASLKTACPMAMVAICFTNCCRRKV